MDDRERQRKEALRAINEALKVMDRITARYESENHKPLEEILKGNESED